MRMWSVNTSNAYTVLSIGITLGGLKKAKKRDESEDKWSE